VVERVRRELASSREKRLLVIDSHSLCHIAKHAYRELFFHGQGNTGVIYGFFMKLFAVAKKLLPDMVCFVWDSSLSLRRELLYPEYKKRKASTPPPTEKDLFVERALRDQISILRDEVVPQLGFDNNFWQIGYEADDVIASVVLADSLYEKIIVSRDRDLYQLIAHDTMWYEPVQNQLWTYEDFVSFWGIEPRCWAEVLAIAGCSGDGVPSLKKKASTGRLLGIGTKTAVKYLKGEFPENHPVSVAVREQEDRLALNRELVQLPLSGTEKVSLIPDSLPSKEAFVEVCNRFGFRSMLDNIAKWIEVFKMV